MNAQELWASAWQVEVADTTRNGEVKLEDLRQSSRSTKANPTGENSSWWYENGQKFVESWITWRSNSGWKIWTTPEGKPAIELGLSVKIGNIDMVGAVDRVFETPEGELVILDLKTGVRTPQSDLQLAVYASMMERAIGVRPNWGTYWMARQGTTTPPASLDSMSLQKLDELVALFEKARQHSLYLPNFDTCKMCSLTEFCYWKNGEKSSQLGEINVL